MIFDVTYSNVLKIKMLKNWVYEDYGKSFKKWFICCLYLKYYSLKIKFTWKLHFYINYMYN